MEARIEGTRVTPTVNPLLNVYVYSMCRDNILFRNNRQAHDSFHVYNSLGVQTVHTFRLLVAGYSAGERNRAEAAGYTAICLTVDSVRFGSREADWRNNFNGLPPGVTLANYPTQVRPQPVSRGFWYCVW